MKDPSCPLNDVGKRRRAPTNGSEALSMKNTLKMRRHRENYHSVDMKEVGMICVHYFAEYSGKEQKL